MSEHEIAARVIDLFTLIGSLALISFGGIITVLPAIHTHLVQQMHWISDRDFATMFAIAQASPGPNVLVLTIIGYRVAGLAGAIAATLALTLPTALIAFAVVKVWDRFRAARWRKAAQAGLVPVAAGFIAAAGFVVMRAADTNVAAWTVSALTLAVAAYTKINPLWMFLVAAILGGTGVIPAR